MFRSLFTEIFSPSVPFGERCVGAFLVFLFIVLIGVFGLLGYVLVDTVGITPTDTTIAVVEKKDVVPGHFTFMFTGKGMFPIYNPESYQLHFEIHGEEVSPAVEKKFFDGVNVGDRIEVDYGLGRLSNSYHPTSIRLIGE